MVKTNYKARAKKAWETRRANASKRGVKPGTKRGPYKKEKNFGIGIMSLKQAKEAGWNVSDDPKSVGNLPSLISQLASSIDSLEVLLTAQIDRIKSILG